MDDRFEEGFNWWKDNSAVAVSGSYTEKYISDINVQVDLLEEMLNSYEGYKTGDKQLKGDMAEYWHAGTFNIDAAVKKSDHQAEVLRSHEFGSVDIDTNFGKTYSGKYMANGKKSAKEQSKTYWEAYKKYKERKRKGKTLSYEDYAKKNGFSEKSKNDRVYESQERLIASDQKDEANSFLDKMISDEQTKHPEQVKRYEDTKKHLTTKVEDGAGVESQELTKEEAESLAADAKKGEVKAEDYGFDAKSVTSAKYVIKESAKSGLYAAVLSMTLKVLPDIAKCIGNAIENDKVDLEELKNVGLDALSSGASAFVQGSITGALVAYCKLGVLGEIYKSATPAVVGTMTVLVFDSLKNMVQCGLGQISRDTFMDKFTWEGFTSINSLSFGYIGQSFIPIPLVGFIISSLAGTVIYTTISKVGDNWVNAYEYNAMYFQKYYAELLQIDLEGYERKIEEYDMATKRIEEAYSIDELNYILNDVYDNLKIEKAWTGDFDSFMGNPNNHLAFK